MARSGHPGCDPGLPAAGRDRAGLGRENPGPGEQHGDGQEDEIARTLFVSEATVKTNTNRIFAKTGSRDRGQAVHYAYTRGYADPPEPR
jgi:hypothetical protein